MPDENERKVLEANIKYHTVLAATYNNDQPHYKEENVARVDAILFNLAARTGGKSLLDLGCGTGFILNIAQKYFKRVVGVDITPAMLEQAGAPNGQIELHQADASHLPFLESDSFDVCTGYSFLHHLLDFKPPLREAFRCLRRGGILYTDQDPNTHYWSMINAIKESHTLPPHLQREVQFVVCSLEESIKGTDLSLAEVGLAEYHDISKGGMDPESFIALLHEIGFQAAEYRYEWFAGQSGVIHGQSRKTAQAIEAYLRDNLPATRPLFKYFSIFAEK